MDAGMKSATRQLFVVCLAVGVLHLFFPMVVESAEDVDIRSKLRLVVRTERQHFKIGEPIAFMGSIDNVTKEDVYFYRLESSGTVTLEIIDATGKTVDAAYPIIDLWPPQMADFALIKPGESLFKNFEVFIPKESLQLSQSPYTISVIYKVWDGGYYSKGELVDLGGWTGTLKSNAIKVEIEK